ncbi:MAG: hypothetical protein HQM03_03685 [Magnetococcales bacterium]|nr:hypothetical protein [Magnetococcales bacterium]
MTTTSLSLAFDALECIDQLKASGVPEEQAKGHVKVLTTIVRQMDSRVDELAAKRDKQSEDRFDSLADRNEQQVKGRLDGLATKQELDTRLATTEANLKRDIEAAKADAINWTAGMFAAQTALIIGAMFAVMRSNQPPPAPQLPVAQEMRMPAPAQPAPPPPAR